MAGGMSTLLVTSTAAKPNPPDRSVVALAPSPVSARPSTPAHYIETEYLKVRNTGHASPPATLAKGPERRSGSVDCFPAVRVPLPFAPLEVLDEQFSAGQGAAGQFSPG